MPIWPPRGTPTLRAALRDVAARDARARLAAAAVLGSAPEAARDEAVAGLLRLADDADWTVRQAALLSLGDLRATSAVERLRQAVDDPAPPVRQAAILALAEVADPSTLPLLVEACADARPEVRFQALAATARLDPDGAEAPVARALADPDPEVRAQAVEVWSELETDADRTRATLGPLLGDPDLRVGRAAALAIGRAGDAAGAEILIGALADDDAFLEAADVLGRLGVQAARAALRRTLSRWLAPPVLKVAAAAALHRLGDAAGREHLIATLRGRRWEAKAYAAELCAELGIVEAREPLERLRDAPGPLDPDTIARALARLSPGTGA